MDGLKVFFDDNTSYFIENNGNIFDISRYIELLSNNSLTISKTYDITPPVLLLNSIVEANINNKKVVKVEWYRDNIMLLSLSGEIQTTYNTNIIDNKVDERIIFLIMLNT